MNWSSRGCGGSRSGSPTRCKTTEAPHYRRFVLRSKGGDPLARVSA